MYVLGELALHEGGQLVGVPDEHKSLCEKEGPETGGQQDLSRLVHHANVKRLTPSKQSVVHAEARRRDDRLKGTHRHG